MSDPAVSKPLTRHQEDAYRVAYLYAFEANVGQPEREKTAERAGQAALAQLLREEREAKMSQAPKYRD